MLLGVYNYTVLLTYTGMIISYLGIALAMRGNIRGALICLMVSGFCDMFDGKIASTKTDRTQKERNFGIQIDSLCDLIGFGVLPAVIVYIACDSGKPAFAVSCFYLLCALIRLAWFNVDEEERICKSFECRKYYVGLPVTSSSLFMPLILGLALYFRVRLNIISLVLLAFMGIAFVTPFRLRKPMLKGKIILLCCGVIELAILLAGMCAA